MNKLKEILFAGTFLTIIFVIKQVLATIPNVQLVVFLMTLFFLHAKWEGIILLLFGYVILDFIAWGYPTLMLPSFAAWIALAFFVKLIGPNDYKLALFTIPFTIIHMIFYMIHDWFFFGLPFYQSLAYLSAGIPFAIPMLVSSFLSIVLLFNPMNKILIQIRKNSI